MGYFSNIFFEKKVIIFCLSFLEVEWCLQIIENNNPNNCIVITNNGRIIKLLTELYHDQIIFSTEAVCFPAIRRNILKFIYDCISFKIQKVRITNLFNSVNNCNVYFFFVAFGIFELYLIKLLSNDNFIFYKPEVDITKYELDNSFSAKIDRFFIYLIIKVSFVSLKNGSLRLRSVSNKFLKQIKAQHLSLPKNKDAVAKLINSKFHLKSFKVLLLVGFTESELINEFEYRKRYNDLISFFVQKFGKDSVALKWHPNSTYNYIFEHKVFVIPQHIPGNLIIDNFEIFCGHVSALLFEAANRNKISISTLDYCSLVCNEIGYKGYFQQNLDVGKKIYFFKDLNSLDELLFNVYPD